MPTILKDLRKLAAEMRKVSSSSKLRETLPMQYVLRMYRANYETDQQLCKAQEEMNHVANTYRCYLESSRQFQQIFNDYRGKGERSVAETASLVGFKLPHDPK